MRFRFNPDEPNHEVVMVFPSLSSGDASVRYDRGMADQTSLEPEILIGPVQEELPKEVEDRLRTELEACPDIAFAHLCLVSVPVHQPAPQLSLFVWLVPEAVGSLRAALNLVSEAVARALPEDLFLDVLILNSAPELLSQVEERCRVFVERDAGERKRAMEAARGAVRADEFSDGR